MRIIALWLRVLNHKDRDYSLYVICLFMDLELRFPIIKLSRHYYQRRCMCPNCENRNNFKNFKLNEKAKYKSCGQALSIELGAGFLPLIAITSIVVFSTIDLIENTLHLVILAISVSIFLRKFNLELQILKIVEIENEENQKQKDEKKSPLKPLKLLLSITIGWFVIAFIWSYFTSNSTLEKKFDYIFSDFKKDPRCVKRAIASFKVDEINKCYTCPSGKKCRVRKE